MFQSNLNIFFSSSSSSSFTHRTSLFLPSISLYRHCCSSSFSSHWQLRLPFKRKKQLLTLRASYEVGGSYSDEGLYSQDRTFSSQQHEQRQGEQKLDSSQYEALLKGGEQVTSVLQEIIVLVCFPLLLYLFPAYLILNIVKDFLNLCTCLCVSIYIDNIKDFWCIDFFFKTFFEIMF